MDDKDKLIQSLKEAIKERDDFLKQYQDDLRYKKSVLEKLDALLENVLHMIRHALSKQKDS